MDDRQAIERYRYLLRTAPPDDIERAHAEAFERLTPPQREAVLRELANQVPASEVASSTDPQALARMATRAEMRDPGTMERTFGAMPAGPGLGGMFLSTLAGAFVGTAIADAMFGSDAGSGDVGAGEASDADYAGGDAGQADSGAYDDGDFGAGDLGGGDFGGGDFGGGDFGGGDFG
jgi:hypothetical protein